MLASKFHKKLGRVGCVMARVYRGSMLQVWGGEKNPLEELIELK
jgi:hypothetical protein